MTKIVLIILALTLQGDATHQGRVIDVIDGSSLILQLENRRLRVQLLGIESPVQSLSDESRKTLSHLVKGKTVRLAAMNSLGKSEEMESVIATVFLEDKDVALEMISEGMVWHSVEHEQYQSPQQAQSYIEAKRTASAAKRGVWGASFKECKTESKGLGQNQYDGSIKQELTGVVRVDVLIDESGKVVSAKTKCGHPVLQTLAVKNVLKLKYRPTIQNGNAVKVSGYLTYIFAP